MKLNCIEEDIIHLKKWWSWQNAYVDNENTEQHGWYTNVVYNEDRKYTGDAQYNDINGISGEWVGWYYDLCCL